jgi:hypothetical protein
MPPNPTADIPVDPRLLSLAVADLAQRLDVPPESVQLVKFESVTWGDSSLGCPEPGMAYSQVLVEGAYLLLQAGDALYEYHSGGSGLPFLCEQGRSTDQESPPDLQLTLPPGGKDT